MSMHISRREFLTVASAAAVSAVATNRSLQTASATDEFIQYDALSLATLVDRGQISAAELLEVTIKRAEALNPQINAIVTPMYDLARARAAGELQNGPFRGVPTLMKDLDDYVGVRTAYGSRLMMENIAKDTHPLGLAIEHMGMVVFGKSATPEFGLLPSTEPAAFGPTRNPWNLEYSPGGSSGGSGAAVAAGLVAIAQGSDGGGSIRVPASNCGIFGLKPTRGRLVERPGTATPGELSVKGFLSRSVRDSELALVGSSSPDAKLAAVNRVPPKRGGLRIAYSTSDFNGIAAHPEVASAIQQTAKLCESLGHKIEEGKPPIDGDKFANAMLTLWADRPWNLVERIKTQSGKRPPEEALEPWTWGLIRWMDTMDRDKVVAEAEAYMLSATQQVDEYFASIDLWLSPVLAEPPVKIGDLKPDQEYEALFDRVIKLVAYTPIANATGVPAMSVPLHWTPAGLPVGSHFVARRGEERTLIMLAKQLEQAQPWADKWPAVSAKGLG